jgi:hypothetical protein
MGDLPRDAFEKFGTPSDDETVNASMICFLEDINTSGWPQLNILEVVGWIERHSLDYTKCEGFHAESINSSWQFSLPLPILKSTAHSWLIVGIIMDKSYKQTLRRSTIKIEHSM